MVLFDEAYDFYYENLNSFIEDLLYETPTKQQRALYDVITTAIREKKHVVVKSGQGVGKTSACANIILWWLNTRPESKVICTAPTFPQIKNVLFSELCSRLNRTVYKNEWNFLDTVIRHKQFSNTWFCLGKSSEKPESMQGFHCENLLIVVDETSGVKDDIIEAIEGTLSQKNNLALFVSNPTRASGKFYNFFHKDRAHCIPLTFNAEMSEIVDKRNIDRLARYGRDSNIYRVRVLGEFPTQEDDSVISIEALERAVQRTDTNVPYEFVEIGVDVARYGENETVICVRYGNVIKMEECFNKKDTMYTVGKVMMHIRKNKDKYVIVNIDDSGVGGGVTDRVVEIVKEENLRVEVNGINNGSAPRDESKFVNLNTELWFTFRDMLHTLQLPNDQDLLAQLSCRKFTITSKGKYAIERKEDMQKRGIESPDRADGVILSVVSLNAQINRRCKNRESVSVVL